MQLIKEKVKFNGQDLKLKIPLSSTNNLGGHQQAINDYIERETGLSINPVTDGETFKYVNKSDDKFFDFEFKIASNYSSLYTFAGFTIPEVNSKADVLTNSFFIMQIYDKINNENQILLHNSYYNGYSFDSNKAEFTLSNQNEFMNLYIPEWYVKQYTGATKVVRVKFLFYNAKFGKLQVFFNKNRAINTDENKLYYDATLFLKENKYEFQTGALNLRELANQQYVDKINESLKSFDNEGPVFPNGEQFNNDGTYTEVTT